MQDNLIVNIIEKFSASDLVEFEFTDEKSRLVLKKEAALKYGTAASLAPLTASDSVTAPVIAGQPGVAPSAPALAAVAAPKSGEAILSPMVGTFYSSPGPDAPNFVSVGKKVKAGETLCILEAMKMMNHFEAEFDCEILSVEAKSGDMVEFGQTLFYVKK